MDPPGEEIVARRHLDPLVTELGDLAWQLPQRQMSVHVRIESDFHGTTPSMKRGAARDARSPSYGLPSPASEAAGDGRPRVVSASRIHPTGGGGGPSWDRSNVSISASRLARASPPAIRSVICSRDFSPRMKFAARAPRISTA